ncbi:hypothetical protein GQL56_13025 [Pseudomonas putida]|nr:hypothetical protein [Pseudomonas putida]
MFFYQSSRLALIQFGAVQRRIVEASSHLLGVIQEGTQASLLATDVHVSVLLEQRQSTAHRCYTPYGFDAIQPWGPGFTGQMQDAITEGYLLGNGYRLYSPKLMRFYSADSWSPFGKGGINAYGYGAGDPVNGTDPTGHIFNRARKFLKMTKYQDSVAAGHAAKVFFKEGRHLLPPSEINVRHELDRRVISAHLKVEKHRSELSTLSDNPKNADLKAFLKERISKNQELINDEVRRDLTVQEKFVVEPSKKYSYEVDEDKNIHIQLVRQ